jgi:hypothetical protein
VAITRSWWERLSTVAAETIGTKVHEAVRRKEERAIKGASR